VRSLIAMLLAGAALATLVILTTGGEDDPYVVTARIADAEGIQKDYVVRVDGVQAGKVVNVDVTRQDLAWVEMELDPEVGGIGENARLSARAANLLGEKYLDLETGDRTKPMPSGSTIPLTRTRSEVQLDDIFNTLDPTTRAQLRILVNEAGLGLAGRGADFNDLLGQLPGTLRETKAVLQQVTAENEALGQLISRSQAVISPSADRKQDVSGFVASARNLLDTTTRRRAQLAATIQQTPATLRQVRASLARLERSATNLEPAAAALRRAAPQLSAVLGRLPAFAQAANGTLDSARKASPALVRLGKQATPDVRRLDSSLRRLSDFAFAARPVTESLGRGRVFAGLLDVMQNWTRAINQSDAIGHYFALRLVISPQAASGLISQLTPPAAGKKRRGRKPTVPKPVKKVTDAVQDSLKPRPSRPGGPVNPVKPLTDGVQKLLDDVTGALGPKSGDAPSSDLLDTILGR